jgi:hypothetical protein
VRRNNVKVSVFSLKITQNDIHLPWKLILLKKEKRKKMKSNKEHTSLFSLKDIPRIMSKAFLTKRFLIIRTFSTAKKQKLG